MYAGWGCEGDFVVFFLLGWKLAVVVVLVGIVEKGKKREKKRRREKEGSWQSARRVVSQQKRKGNFFFCFPSLALRLHLPIHCSLLFPRNLSTSQGASKTAVTAVTAGNEPYWLVLFLFSWPVIGSIGYRWFHQTQNGSWGSFSGFMSCVPHSAKGTYLFPSLELALVAARLVGPLHANADCNSRFGSWSRRDGRQRLDHARPYQESDRCIKWNKAKISRKVTSKQTPRCHLLFPTSPLGFRCKREMGETARVDVDMW